MATYHIHNVANRRPLVRLAWFVRRYFFTFKIPVALHFLHGWVRRVRSQYPVPLQSRHIVVFLSGFGRVFGIVLLSSSLFPA